jgi:glutamyl-tRNA reductase
VAAIFSHNKHTEHFVVLGTNFTKADTLTRSRFAITKAMEEEVYKQAESNGFSDFFLISTCNRTEFYTCAPLSALKKLIAVLLSVTDKELDTYFYGHSGQDAVQHFFRVVSGLDSQIIGDYEIVCQVKAALDKARQYNLVGTITDRISNFAYQAQKKVKAHTSLSSGKYSVSYAAAEMIFHESQTHTFNNILLVGAGDFGASVARNLRHYFPVTNLTITNRTREKAEKVAAQVKAKVIDFESFSDQLHRFDVMITTVGVEHYLIQPAHIGAHQLLLDLSVPQAVDPAVKEKGVRLFSVDEVSSFHNKVLQQRKMEVPRAQKIIDHFIGQLMEWQQLYNHCDLVMSYKRKIELMHERPATRSDVASIELNRKVEKTFSLLMREIRAQGFAGCRMIEAMNSLVPAEK